MSETSSLYISCYECGFMIYIDVNSNTYIDFEFENNEKDP